VIGRIGEWFIFRKSKILWRALRGVERGTACSEKVKILFEWFILIGLIADLESSTSQHKEPSTSQQRELSTP
jgi:hypothetical protein